MYQKCKILTNCTTWCKFDQNPLRKHAYSNILNILPPKNESVQIKNSDIFHISANKKNNVYPCKTQFYCIKVGFKKVKII